MQLKTEQKGKIEGKSIHDTSDEVGEDSGKIRQDIEVTPEMVRAGGWAYDYWRIYEEDTADADEAAKSIFNIMLAIANGRITVDVVINHSNPRIGREFYRTTVERIPG